MEVDTLTPVVSDVDSLGVHIVHFNGDITALKCDAIISSTNSTMQHSSGVHGKICKLGGLRFEENLKELRKKLMLDEKNRGLKSGSSAICKAEGDLLCKFVIMTNSPGVTKLNDLKNVSLSF